MPAGFPCYVRVFHPAYDIDRDVSQPWETRTPVRWMEIAAARGTQVHPGMQLPAIARTWAALDHRQDGVFDHPPATGTLPEEVAPTLAATLARHTETPDRCWFAVWNGFGDIREDVRQAPTFRVPAREYFLVHGPIEAICESTRTPLEWQSANIWWPDDHAWCVATEIDL